MRRKQIFHCFIVILSAAVLLTCAGDDDGIAGPTATPSSASNTESGSALSSRSGGTASAQNANEEFNCQGLQEWFVRFSMPGYVKDNLVGLYYNYVGCPARSAKLEIFWDEENEPTRAEYVRLGPGEIQRDDDNRTDHSGIVAHRYTDISEPTRKVVRANLILDGLTGNCATVRRVTVSPPPPPTTPVRGATIDIEKLTNGIDADNAPGPTLAPGAPVSWTYELSNLGQTDLVNVMVSDDQGVVVFCPMTTLPSGASMICTALGSATVGQYRNVGTVTATGADGVVVTDSDPSHYLGESSNVSIDLEKSTNGVDADDPPGPTLTPSDPVTWAYLVTNTGADSLSNVSVTDDQGVAVSCPQTTLATGQSMTCTATGTATIGQYGNVGIVTATGADGVVVTDSDPSHYLGESSNVSIDLEKSTNGVDADDPPGPTLTVFDPVTWTYLVTNTGADSLSNVSVTDDQGLVVSCPRTTLPSGASMICTASGSATVGQYQNVGTVTGTDAGGVVVTDSDLSHYFGQTSSVPAIDIEKSTNGMDADTPPGARLTEGDPVTWTYEISNSGIGSLSNVSVTDDQGVAVSCPQTTLATGQSMTCTATGTATIGQYGNVGTVTATGAGGVDVTDSDPSHYLGESSNVAVDIEKSTNGVDADDPPGPTLTVFDPVTWTYLVTNTGAASLSNVSLTDDQGVAVSCPQTTLATGQSMTCTATGTATIGQYGNVGTVTATGATGMIVTDSDPSHYFGQALTSSVDIEKSTNGQDADVAPGPNLAVGDQVNWTYQVANNGVGSLSSVSVTDDQGVVVSCPQDTLAAGASMTCTATGTAVVGQYRNVGTVTATDAGSVIVTDSDPSHYFVPSSVIDIEKSTNGVDADTAPGPFLIVGDQVNWTYQVTNNGMTSLSGVSVTDDQVVMVSCPQTTLAPGESMTCTASGIVAAGQYQNVGTVTAPDGGGRFFSDSDPSHYFGGRPPN